MVPYHCFMADLADPQKRLSLMCLGIQKDRLDISKQKGNIMRILLIEDDKNQDSISLVCERRRNQRRKRIKDCVSGTNYEICLLKKDDIHSFLRNSSL